MARSTTVALVASVGLALALTTGVQETLATPVPPKPGTTVAVPDQSPAAKAFEAAEQKLDAAYDLIEKRGETSDDAFTTVRLDVASNTLTILRVGDRTTLYDDLIPSGTKLLFQHSIISFVAHDQLLTAVSELQPKLASAGTVINTFGLLGGDDGPFEVYYTGLPPAAAVMANLPAASFEFHEPMYQQVSAATRYTDTNPFLGGTLMNAPAAHDIAHPGGSHCSSGFGVKSNVNGSTYLTTSGHCFSPYDTRMWTGSPSTYVGQVTASSSHEDVAFINATAAGQSAQNYIYDGGYNANSAVKLVVGASAPRANDLTCVSGAYMRAVCNVRIDTNMSQGVTETNDYSGTTYTAYVYHFTQIDGNPAISDGDSGGPIFTNTNANTQAIARGFITLGDTSGIVACPTFNSGGTCTSEGGFTSAAAVMTSNDVTFSY